MAEEHSGAHTAGPAGGDASRPWQTLSSGFEQARALEDSLDRLVEWPAQRTLLGDVTGLAVLDAGCGNGAKIAQLALEGAGASVGVDIGVSVRNVSSGASRVEWGLVRVRVMGVASARGAGA